MAHEHNRQRKLERKAKKASKRRQQTRREPARASISPGAIRGLGEAEELIADGDYDEAIELLEELARRNPRRPEILVLLAEAYLDNEATWSHQATCQRLTVAAPDDPLAWLALGLAAVENAQFAAAHQALTHLANRWPDHSETAETRQMRESMLEFLTTECQRRGLDVEVGLRVLLLHDEVNLHLHLGKFDKVCDSAARLLAICPSFAPALNNRGEAHFRQGHYSEAIADSQRVLGFDPTNYHALANLTRYLYLAGRFDEAQASAVALRACDAAEGDAFLKKAETFAFLGDWQAVRQAVLDGQSHWDQAGGTPGMAEHLAGVALANLGDLGAARQHWRRAANAANPVPWASENLKDSKLPVGERHGPWAFPIDQWLPLGTIKGLFESVKDPHTMAARSRKVQRHFERYPQLDLLADVLLERSDPATCEFLVTLAGFAERPAILAALQKFARGQRGSDDLRMKALMTLSEAGCVDDEEVEIWREGSLHTVSLVSQEIYSEPTTELPPEFNHQMVAAFDLLCAGRGAEAQSLLDELLKLFPDDVSVQFNRAAAINLQGRKAEFLEIVRQIHRQHPDYVFARACLAEKCIIDGDLEQAKSLLAPISQMRRLHTTEYGAWCGANISLALAQGETKAARSLLSAWEKLDPDNHRIKIYQERLRGGIGKFSRLRRLLFGNPDAAE